MIGRESAAVLAGACSSVATVLLFTSPVHDLGYPLWEFYHTGAIGPVVLFALVGAVPAVALVRHRLVSPTVILGLAVSAWLRGDAALLPAEPVVGVLSTLVLTYLLAMVLLGWFEFSLRSRVRLLPSPE